MATVDVVNLKNEKVGTIDLLPEVFEAPIRKHILSEVVNWQRACRRAGTHSTLSKGEVSGTTKKPFAQKGRGCARQGSTKNPHQIGGGVAFGPKPRDYSYALPKAKKRAALAVALSARLKENSIKIVKDFELSEPKTSVALAALAGLGLQKSLVVDSDNVVLKRCMKNLPNSKFLNEAGLNVYDILHYPELTMTESAVKALQERVI